MQKLNYVVVGEQGCGRSSFISHAMHASAELASAYTLPSGVYDAAILDGALLHDVPTVSNYNVAMKQVSCNLVAAADALIFMISAKKLFFMVQEEQLLAKLLTEYAEKKRADNFPYNLRLYASWVEKRNGLLKQLNDYANYMSRKCYVYFVITKIDEVDINIDSLTHLFKQYLQVELPMYSNGSSLEPVGIYTCTMASNGHDKPTARGIVNEIHQQVSLAEGLVANFRQKFGSDEIISKELKNKYVEFFRDSLKQELRHNKVASLLALYAKLSETVAHPHLNKKNPLRVISRERSWFRTCYGKTKTFERVSDILATEIVSQVFDDTKRAITQCNEGGASASPEQVVKIPIECEIKHMISAYHGRSFFGSLRVTPAKKMLLKKIGAEKNVALREQLASHFDMPVAAAA